MLRGSLLSIISDYEDERRIIKGEYVLVIEGKSLLEKRHERQEAFEAVSIKEHFLDYMAKGMDKKEAMKAVAKSRGISKRDVYNELLDNKEII